ncbi:MAG: glycosyltransferase, partial [Bdellovibrionales bacterium]|nr:glycosyltransferase [Bdellovibrionales bacterium]
RIWVLSKRVKQIILKYLDLPESSIGVIPRSELDDISTSPNPNNVNWENINLVYAGRISVSKNITGLLKIYNELEKNKQIKLNIFGEFDDLTDPSWGRYKPFNYRDEVNHILSDYKWKNKPCFHGHVNIDQWIKSLDKSSIFISISTSMFEDFGTAAFEAHKNNSPGILSDWGGHADQIGTDQFKIPISYIPQSYEPEFIQNIKAKLCANHLFDNRKIQTLNNQNVDTLKFTCPNWIKLEDFQSALKKFNSLNTIEILDLIRNGLANYADTQFGHRFFINYREIMSNYPIGKTLVIYPENFKTANSTDKEKIFLKQFEDLFDYDNKFVFANNREFLKFQFFDRMDYFSDLIVIKEKESLSTIASLANDFVSKNQNIHIFEF